MDGRTPSQDEVLAVANLIDRFLDGDVGPFEWDDFCSYRQRTPEMETLRVEIAAIESDYPATESGHWCSSAGLQRLREIAQQVRGKGAA